MKGLAAAGALLVGVIVSVGVLLEDHQARLPGIESARGRAWVLLAGHYEEALRSKTGQYRACADVGECMAVLGWPLTLRRLPGKTGRIDATASTYRATLRGVWKEGGPGAWVKEPGGEPYFLPDERAIPKKVLDTSGALR